jgi:hypothetical protein
MLLVPLVGCAPLIWWLVARLGDESRGVRGPALEVELRAPAAADLVAAPVTEPSPLRFAWPASGRIRVDAEHRRDLETVRESFDLVWRTLAGGERLVETHALERTQLVLPGPLRVGSAPLFPVQAVIASDGRYLGVPHEDELRAVWDDTIGHHAEDPAPAPLADVWRDWVERWLGLALAPGEERAVATGNELGRASVTCERLDTERVRLVWRLARSTATGVVEHGPLRHEHERVVTAELWTDGMRPRSVTSTARWTWRSEMGVLVRTLERSSRYDFDWADIGPAEGALAGGFALPDEILTWSARCWPELGGDERADDERGWRELWPRLTVARREQLGEHFGSSWSIPRVRWLRVQPLLRRLWLAEDPLAPSRLPVLTWVEHAPRENAVDVLFVGDGYAADELAPGGKYEADVERIARGMLAEPPLAWYRDWFNVRVAHLESPRFAPHGALRIRQDGRMLVVGDQQRLAEVVRIAGDADIVLVLANRADCAASGNHLAPSVRSVGWRAAPVMSAGCPDPVGTALHEIGHSFGRLADEYEDAAGIDLARMRLLEAPNLTAGERPSREYAPWMHFLELPGADALPWMHEGAYYRSKGWWRPWPFCRMRESHHPFCPVCSEALARAIHAACGLPFNDESYHAAHPLERWRR